MNEFQELAQCIVMECLRMSYEDMITARHHKRMIIPPTNFLVAMNNLFFPYLKYQGD